MSRYILIEASFLFTFLLHTFHSRACRIPGGILEFVGEVLKVVAEIRTKDGTEAAGLSATQQALLLTSGTDMRLLVEMSRGPRQVRWTAAW